MAKVSLSNRLKNQYQVATEALLWEAIADTILEDTFKPYFKNHEVVVSLVESEEIKELNRLYRYKNEVTDVLSFNAIGNLSEDLDKFEDLSKNEDLDAEDSTLGDIIICVPIAHAQAQARAVSLNQELIMLYIHGFLHLLGYDHATKEEAEQMFGLQNQILEKHGFSALQYK